MKHSSGKDIIKILCNKFGFVIDRKRGSHVVLRKGSIGTVVPMHKEIKKRTFKSILKLAKISEEEFSKFQ